MDFQSFIKNLAYDNCCKEMKTVLKGCRVSIEAITKNKRIHIHTHSNVTYLYNRKLLFIQKFAAQGKILSIRFTPIVTVVIATASSETTTTGPNLGQEQKNNLSVEHQKKRLKEEEEFKKKKVH